VTQRATRLREQFGDIDIHLFDQLLRGRIAEGMTVLDAGGGEGRNRVGKAHTKSPVAGSHW
jgi:hypothetical protein